VVARKRLDVTFCVSFLSVVFYILILPYEVSMMICSVRVIWGVLFMSLYRRCGGFSPLFSIIVFLNLRSFPFMCLPSLLAYVQFICLFSAQQPHWARAFSFTRFLDHTKRRTTVGRTTLGEWSARRRDLYLTTHNTHNRQTSISPVGFEPAISAGERPQTYVLDSAATGTGGLCTVRNKIHFWPNVELSS
jgi:hypothetical protein